MHVQHKFKLLALSVAIQLSVTLTQTVYADTGGISNVQSFIKSIITVLASLAGLVATVFFVAGGFSYMTSAGNPDRLDRAKRTIMYSAVGLAITIAAFVISNIVTTLATNAFGN